MSTNRQFFYFTRVVSHVITQIFNKHVKLNRFERKHEIKRVFVDFKCKFYFIDDHG